MTFAGVLQASIAWPDRQAERHIVDDLGRHGIAEIGPGAQVVTAAEPFVVDGEKIVEAGDQLAIEGDGATVLPSGDSPDGAAEPAVEPLSEAQAIRNYLAEHGSGVTNKAVIAALKAQGINVTSSQVSAAKNKQ